MTDSPDTRRHRRGRGPRDRDRGAALRPVRARRPAVPRPALLGGDADDPQPRRRRGPGAGDLREGVLLVPPVPAGHQPQGVALPDPHEHLHQHLPQEAARAAAVDGRGRRGLAARARRVAHLDRPALRRDGGARAPARLAGQGRPAAAPGGVPARGLPRRRRGLRLQGDRRDHGDADRHRHVPAAPRSPPAARHALGLRARQRPAAGRPRREATS